VFSGSSISGVGQPKRLPNLELIASINATLAKKNASESVASPTDSGEKEDLDAAAKKRKRKSRWGTDDYTDKLFIPGMPTILPANLSKEQEEAYLRKYFFWHDFDTRVPRVLAVLLALQDTGNLVVTISKFFKVRFKVYYSG